MSQNTPNLALPYPELTDTADVPRDIKALADKLDALLGGGGGGGGTGTLPLAAAPVLDVGLAGQIRAGRQLSAADFTALGLSAPVGLWSLSDLSNQGSDGRPLVNLGAVPFAIGINGLPTTAAQFTGATGQALYIADTGTSDPYRIRTGTVGCWFKVARRSVNQALVTKWSMTAGQQGWLMRVDQTANALSFLVSTTGSDTISAIGLSDVVDDRWHFGVVTADGTALSLYVDAVPEVRVNAGPMFGATVALNVGAFNADGSTAATNPFFGRVDEAFVTADILTDDQIRLLYCTRLAHTLGTIPTGVRLKVHRRRRGPALAVADFPTQPIRLHNFTAGALTDQGSGAAPLTNNGAAAPTAGADGTPLNAFNFNGANNQSLSSTDTGLPGGITARSYGCWFKTTTLATMGLVAWGTTVNVNESRLTILAGGNIQCVSGPDSITGPIVTDGRWHFVVASEDTNMVDGMKRKLYLDGRFIGGSTVQTATVLGGANHFRIGMLQDATFPLTGQLDAAFVCGYALTGDQIAALYAKGAQDLGGSPKNAGDHVERVDATGLLWIADTLESQHTIDLGVVA